MIDMADFYMPNIEMKNRVDGMINTRTGWSAQDSADTLNSDDAKHNKKCRGKNAVNRVKNLLKPNHIIYSLFDRKYT